MSKETIKFLERNNKFAIDSINGSVEEYKKEIPVEIIILGIKAAISLLEHNIEILEEERADN